MKIWVDITNSPHINFFKPFINKWLDQGHEVIITARDLANTIDLIKFNNWNFLEIGGHAGRNKIMKLLYFPRRVYLLYKFLKKAKPDIGISHSSFYSPVAGKISGIPTLYLNDNEHASGNLIAFRFSTLNILPEFLLPYSKTKGWDKKYKIDYYPGIKEGIYLSQLNIRKIYAVNFSEKRHIFIRLEPWTAQYYKGQNDFLDELIIKIKKQYLITILPRGQEQAKHYCTDKFLGIEVAQHPIPLEEVVEKCDLFIGAGGSMTRELAYIGVSTISVYQDSLLEVDKFLISNNFMHHTIKPTEKLITEIINKRVYANNNSLKDKGIVAFDFINQKITEYAKN